MGQKNQRPSDDPKRLDRVRDLECCVCRRFGMAQMSPTTAHHPICGRYSTRKAPDADAIPLCDGHHQGQRDKSKLAIHNGKETWVLAYGPDTDYIEDTRERL